MSNALRARIGQAYDRVCARNDTQNEAPGGFIPEAGGFLPEVEEQFDTSPVLALDRLPQALAAFDLDVGIQDEIETLLKQSAYETEDGLMISREHFIEALEIVLSQQEFSESDASENYVPDYEEGSDSASDPEEKRIHSDSLPKRKDVHEKARFLYRLLLERIPLVPSSALPSYPKDQHVISEVDDHQLESRRIGIEELRFAAQSLGERPTSNEVRVLLISSWKCSRKRAPIFALSHTTKDPRILESDFKSRCISNSDLPI